MPRASKAQEVASTVAQPVPKRQVLTPGPAGPTAEPPDSCPGLGAVHPWKSCPGLRAVGPGRAAQAWGLPVLEELEQRFLLPVLCSRSRG